MEHRGLGKITEVICENAFKIAEYNVHESCHGFLSGSPRILISHFKNLPFPYFSNLSKNFKWNFILASKRAENACVVSILMWVGGSSYTSLHHWLPEGSDPVT